MSWHESNVKLWDETHDPIAMLGHNIGLVHTQAWRHAKHMNRRHLIDDYDSAAAIGFLQAFEKRDWDAELGALGTFVMPRMRSAMQRYVDKPQGTYGITPSNSIVSGTRDGAHMPEVGSLHYQIGGDDDREFGDVVPDPRQEYELERVDEVISAQQDVSRLLHMADPENLSTLTDMLAHITKHGELKVAQWAQDAGVSANTIYNRLGVLNRVLRTLFPDMVIGDVPLGSAQAWDKYVVRNGG